MLNANAGEFMQFVEPERPFSMLGVDFVGPFRESDHGNKYLLTATCFYSRWPIAVPVRDCTAETAAKALFAHVFSIFGVPDKILTDRGSHFNSNMMKALYGVLGIQKLTTSAYRPSTNGRCERFHRFLNIVRSLLVARKLIKVTGIFLCLLFYFPIA